MTPKKPLLVHLPSMQPPQPPQEVIDHMKEVSERKELHTSMEALRLRDADKHQVSMDMRGDLAFWYAATTILFLLSLVIPYVHIPWWAYIFPVSKIVCAQILVWSGHSNYKMMVEDREEEKLLNEEERVRREELLNGVKLQSEMQPVASKTFEEMTDLPSPEEISAMLEEEASGPDKTNNSGHPPHSSN